MARGWESKSVESQQEEAARASSATGRPPLTAAERLTLERRRTLELARARVVADLARSVAPAHREMLERTLAAIDDELRRLGPAAVGPPATVL
jgi:hypothetical protein